MTQDLCVFIEGPCFWDSEQQNLRSVENTRRVVGAVLKHCFRVTKLPSSFMTVYNASFQIGSCIFWYDVREITLSSGFICLIFHMFHIVITGNLFFQLKRLRHYIAPLIMQPQGDLPDTTPRHSKILDPPLAIDRYKSYALDLMLLSFLSGFFAAAVDSPGRVQSSFLL